MHEKVFPSRILADVSRQCTLSYASQDPVALNAIVCTTAGACYAHYGDIKHGYAAMHSKGEAIRCLKQELTKSGKPPISVSTLYAVSLLLWVEVRSKSAEVCCHLLTPSMITVLTRRRRSCRGACSWPRSAHASGRRRSHKPFANHDDYPSVRVSTPLPELLSLHNVDARTTALL